MGNITNLATHGNYATEANGLKVAFAFVINNDTRNIKSISAGTVTEVDAEDDNSLADFATTEYGRPTGSEIRLSINVRRGREVELATAIAGAISGLEAKIVAGEAL